MPENKDFSIALGQGEPAGARTVAGRVLQILRERILTLALAPGAAMSEQETAAGLQVSRTPVREAFLSLAREKMVIIHPQRRTQVARISLERVCQERFLRESIEAAVLEQFLLHPSAAALNRMEETLLAQQQAADAGDAGLFFQADDAFHRLLYEAADAMLCHQVLSRNSFDYQRLRYLSSLSAPDIQRLNLQQHRELLARLREGDLAGAQALLRTHLRRVFDEIKTLSAVYPDYFE